MQKKYRIAILGLGGVGGFIGGKLAAAYNQSDTEVVFVARGNNAQAIRENGLKLITSSGEMIVHPDGVADEPGTVGKIDLLLCCTKAYDLEDSLKALSSAVTPDTLVLPLLNGVDIGERVQLLLPKAKVLKGCIYLVSKLMAPGVVQQRGEFYSLHFGGDKSQRAEMQQALDLFVNAGINAVLEENIYEKIWSKFSFISPIATYTSAYDISVGKILESSEHTNSLKKLMGELVGLAKTMNVHLPADCIDKNFLTMAKLPYETTSSMHADFASKRPTELETLTGYVVRKAMEKGVEAHLYAKMYQLLGERLN